MSEYEAMYKHLFNAVTDAIEMLPGGSAKDMLILAQQECEQMYILAGETEKENLNT